MTESLIGTDARKLPDGTVAVVKYPTQRRAFVRKVEGGVVYCVDEELKATHVDPDPNPATVIAIIKMGEPRAKTFADVPEYEAWKDEEGNIKWHDGQDMLFVDYTGLPIVEAVQDPGEHDITPDMHRVGMITGVMIDGKPYNKETK